MKKNIEKNIDLHKLLKNCINNKNDEILTSIEQNNIDQAMNFIDERDQMIGLINKIQGNIEKLITDLNGLKTKEVKDWYDDTCVWITNCEKCDDLIIEKLTQMKKEIKKEISATHANRVKIKGYNLNNLSK